MSIRQLSWLLSLSLAAGAVSAGDDPDGRPAGASPLPVPSPPLVPDSPRVQSRGGDVPESNPIEPADQVIADDLIVQGSLCAGADCVNAEAFPFTTLKLKENNTRLVFDDTSTGAFPANDWSLEANESASSGLNYFAIRDLTADRLPVVVRAGAPANALVVDPSGRIGLRTNAPALDVHLATVNTPAHRLEQTNAGGFTAQTWDIAGNEANFFIRDLTAGSRLPFRIRPGAATSSVDIFASGVAIRGTAANAMLDVFASFPVGAPDSGFRVTNPQYGASTVFENVPEENRFEVDSDGNVTARGAITQLSSRSAKENLVPVDGSAVLARLAGLPLLHWNYIGAKDGALHLGPTAEDFHAAFGLGDTPRTVALADLAGVALAAVQALETEVRERDARLAAQESRLKSLEQRLAALEAAP